MTKARELVLVALAVLALAVVTTWPLARDARGALPGDLGDPLFGTFVLAWDADALARGLSGLWQAPFYFPWPDTLALAEHLLGIALFTAPLQWLTRNPVLVYNLAFLGSYALAGVGMYLLTLSLWKRRDAAFIAACAFAFAPHRVMHVGHLQVLLSGWMPISLWGLHTFLASGFRRALAVFVVAFILLGMSNGYYLYFFGMAVAVLAGVEVWRRSVADSTGEAGLPWRLIAHLSVAAGGIAIAFVPVAQAYLRARDTLGLHRGLGELRGFSASLVDYVRIPPGLWLWAGRLDTGAQERCLFPGVFTIVLALLALLRAVPRATATPDASGDRERPLVWIYGAIAVLAAWMTLGPFARGPYRLLIELVPGFEGLRVPARFIVIVSLALAVLAAGGVAWLLQRLRPGLAIPVTILLSTVIVLEGSGAPVVMERFDPAQLGRRQVNAWLKMSPPGGVLELPISMENPAEFTLTYQFNTLIHRHPIVNGYSGYDSVLQRLLGDGATPLRGSADDIAATVEGLRRIGVRYIVLHDVLFTRFARPWSPDPRRIADALSQMPDQVISRRHENNIWTWQLADTPPAGPAAHAGLEPVPVARFTAHASHASEDLRFAFDGRMATYWTTTDPQRGDEWMRVTFDGDRDIRGLDLAMGKEHVAEYPRRLVVVAEDAAGHQQTVFNGSVIAGLIEGIGRDSRDSRIRLELPANRTRVMWLRQAGAVDGVPWTVADIVFWERR